MSDYTITTDFSPKDALPVNDPEKLILGSDLDVEFEAIQTAIATKYDSNDIATQAQAEAGTSNTVLITPLRMAQYLNQAGGGGAGIVGDLITLTDPGADRILFWDDSAGAAGFLTAGTGLTISGTTITTDDANINHDSLTGFVADEHVAHSGVTLTAGEGLTGGGTIAASRSFALSFSGLTAETTYDTANDVLAFYDASAAAHRKTTMDSLLGAELGDGHWYRNAAQSLSAATEATVVYDTAEYDELTRGSFSVSTGQYTRGTSAGRIFIVARVGTAAQNDDSSVEIEIQVNSVTKLRAYFYNDTDNDAPENSHEVSGCLNLSASDVVRVRATSSSAESLTTGTSKTYVSIVELS